MMVRKAKTAIPTEDQEQIKLATWLDKNNILYFAIPNGGRRSLLEGIKFKRSGVKAGVPDLCIPIPTKRYHGLWIELKRIKGGALSKEQQRWLNDLREKGYCAEVSKGFEAAKDLVLDYLYGKKE